MQPMRFARLRDWLDSRYDLATAPGGGTAEAQSAADTVQARIRGWVAFRHGSDPDAFTPLLAADVLPPSGAAWAGAGTPRPCR